MTPKEKAQELVGKCFDIFINDENEHYVRTAWELSKQFALIMVNELIYHIDWHEVNYWIEVKQEIEKL